MKVALGSVPKVPSLSLPLSSIKERLRKSHNPSKSPESMSSWITLDDDNKVQGIDKACDYLSDHPELYKSLEQRVNEVLYV